MKIELRQNESLKDIRNQNYVPGVMYGKSMPSTNIKVEKQELLNAIATYGKSMVFKVRLDGKYHHVYIKGVQSKVLKPKEIIHVDLHRVTASEKITNPIPIELKGQEKFHHGSLHIDMNLNEIVAEYSPGQGVSSIVVDVSNLELGDQICVKDLKVDEALTLKDDPNHIILSIRENKVIEETTDDESIDEPLIEQVESSEDLIDKD